MIQRGSLKFKSTQIVREYELNGSSITPIPGSKQLEYDIFREWQIILKDFYNLLIDVDSEHQKILKARSKVQKNKMLNQYKNTIEPELIFNFIKKHGLFGVREDRQGKDYIGDPAHLEDARYAFINSDVGTEYYQNFYMEPVIDVLSEEQAKKAGGYTNLFPGEEYCAIDFDYEMAAPTYDCCLGETVEQITSNFRFVELQRDFMTSRYIERVKTSPPLKTDFEALDIGGITYENGEMKFIVKSLIEALSIMHVLNKTSKKGNVLRTCPECGEVFEVNTNSPNLYCPDPDGYKNCQVRAKSRRYRQRKKSINPTK